METNFEIVLIYQGFKKRLLQMLSVDFTDVLIYFRMKLHPALNLCFSIRVKESQKDQNFHFDLQIHPTRFNSTYLHCQMTGFISTRVQIF